MNHQIRSLMIGNIFQSLHCSSLRMQQSKLTVFGSSFSRIANSAFQMNSFSNSAIFNHCSFTYFLGHPISVNTNEKNSVYIGERQSYVSPADRSISFTFCMFRECQVANDDGGAIYVWDVSGNVQLNVLHSSFYRCQSNLLHGGAIYFVGGSISIKESCFDYCAAPESSGQAVEAQTSKDGNMGFEGISVSRCAPIVRRSDSSSASFSIIDGIQKIANANFSNSYVSDIYSTIHSDDSDSIILSFCNFANNIGSIVLGIEDHRFNDDISYLNFVDNKVDDADYGLIYLNGIKSVMKTCVFYYNTPILFHASRQIEVNMVRCILDRSVSQANYTDNVMVTLTECEFKNPPNTYKVSIFDSRYCWMINPPTLPAGPSTNILLLFIIAFFGLVSYGLYIYYPTLAATCADPSAYDHVAD